MPSGITGELWADLGPLVARAKRPRAGAPPGLPDRPFLEALVCLADGGCEWRHPPDRFGAWDAVCDRSRRGVDAGAVERPFAAPPPACPGLDGVRRVFVDSTVVRAHAAAAGAAGKRGARPGRPSAGAGAGSGPRATSPAPTTGRRSR